MMPQVVLGAVMYQRLIAAPAAVRGHLHVPCAAIGRSQFAIASVSGAADRIGRRETAGNVRGQSRLARKAQALAI